MKGDFSRLRFDAARQYTSVLQQQGRVALDADANEQCFINERLRDATNIDVIGPVGGPAGSAGFGLTIESDGIFISAGRYYVDGLLVENPARLAYDDQPYLLDAPKSKEILLALIDGGETAAAQFILEVWQRLVTELDDPCLAEPALGEADTTVRLQTVWRVIGAVDKRKVVRQDRDVGVAAPLIEPTRGSCASGASNPIASLSPCCQLLYGLKPPAHTGAMGAETNKSGDCGCQPVSPAGYQGLENQLYRVEIHRSGTLDTATFKWSRENGSVVTGITGVNGAVVTVESLGRDANLGFQPGQWVELSDDAHLFGPKPNRPGELYLIQSIDWSAKQVTMTAPVTGLMRRHPQMRRWDQSGPSATADGVALSASGAPLENGIEIGFRKGDYFAGDYWTIPARAATGAIEWPPCGSPDRNLFQPPLFTPIGLAPIACIHWRRFIDQEDVSANSVDINPRLFEIDDCRVFFPPLVALCGASAAKAVHIESISWDNDDYMTLDTLAANGLKVIVDQTLSSPVTGASFIVTLEWTAPASLTPRADPLYLRPDWPPTVLRSITILDTYTALTVDGMTISWKLPFLADDPEQTAVLTFLDVLLSLGVNAKWYARLRVRLLGRAIYANAPNGQIYLDGEAFGKPATRVDGSAGVGLQFPSGANEKASDFESWFYLLPIVLIASAVIQGREDRQEKTVTSVTVQVDGNNNVTGLTTTNQASVEVTDLQAAITLNYAPLTATKVNLLLTGPGVGSVISIAATLVIPAGKKTGSSPIRILSNPSATNNYTLIASVTTAINAIAFNPPPTLAVSGPTAPVRLA